MSTNQTVSTSSPRYPIFLTSPHSVLTSRRGPPRCCVICTRLAAKGDVEPGLRELEEAVRLKPNDPLTHYNCGYGFMQKQDLAAALEECQKAVALDRNFAQAHACIGFTFERMGNIPQAVDAYRVALSTKPYSSVPMDRGGLLYQTATLLEQQYQYSEALPYWEEAAKVRQEDVATRGRYSSALERAGEHEKAIGELREVLKVHPDNYLAHADLAQLFVHQEKFDSAIDEFLEALKLATGLPNDEMSNLHFGLGEAFEKKEELESAEREYRQAVLLQPSYAKAQFKLGRLLLDRGDKKDALEAFRQASTLEPYNSTYRESYEKLSREQN